MLEEVLLLKKIKPLISEILIVDKESREVVTIETTEKGIPHLFPLLAHLWGQTQAFDTTGHSVCGPQGSKGERQEILWDRIWIFETPSCYWAIKVQEVSSSLARVIMKNLEEILTRKESLKDASPMLSV